MTKAFLIDAAERVGSSFVETVIAAVSAGAIAGGFNVSTAHTLLIAGLTAAAATAKSLVASQVHGISPASLVSPARPPSASWPLIPGGPVNVASAYDGPPPAATKAVKRTTATRGR